MLISVGCVFVVSRYVIGRRQLVCTPLWGRSHPIQVENRGAHGIAATLAARSRQTAWIDGVARAVNRQCKSSRRVRYLRSTVKDSNFGKALLIHDFRNGVARESLRRGLCTGRARSPRAIAPNADLLKFVQPPARRRAVKLRSVVVTSALVGVRRHSCFVWPWGVATNRTLNPLPIRISLLQGP